MQSVSLQSLKIIVKLAGQTLSPCHRNATGRDLHSQVGSLRGPRQALSLRASSELLSFQLTAFLRSLSMNLLHKRHTSGDPASAWASATPRDRDSQAPSFQAQP